MADVNGRADESNKNKNISPPLATTRSNVRADTNFASSLSFLRNGALSCSERIGDDLVRDRPPTPALSARFADNPLAWPIQEERVHNRRLHAGGATREPPASPTHHLYALLLHRALEISRVNQPSPPAQLEWTPNTIQARNNYNGRGHGVRSRDVFLRRNQDTELGHNRNLPSTMVRIHGHGKEPDNMNGIEDAEGNHACQDLGCNMLEGDATEDAPENRASISQETQGIPNVESLYQEEWPMHRAMWTSGPSCIGVKEPLDAFVGDDIMSLSTSSAATRPAHHLATKVEMVYGLLSMLGGCSREDMSRTLLEMSASPESCRAMRNSGCLPLLIQLLHGDNKEGDEGEDAQWSVREARRRAGRALHNVVHARAEDRRGRREARVLRLLEQIRDCADLLREGGRRNENLDLHPGPAIAALMKLSFDEEHRHAMCQLGGVQAIAELIEADQSAHGGEGGAVCCAVRRYAGMALTNLTFGDGTNKALLCSMRPFMRALVAQLHSPNEDLRQVTASILRNLSWRADATSKQILREVRVVATLVQAAMQVQKESTLKSILSALWNLSAHCSENKAEVCAVEGALEFLVSMLTYRSASSTLAIVENGGGILRNVSSHVALNDHYRDILRKHRCLQTLLAHLKSPSLTVVSNACGTLWNLSARCPEDQKALWEMGAVGMLRNLIHSKHKMISMGSSAALKNLLAARPQGTTSNFGSLSCSPYSSLENSMHSSTGGMPSLLARKQKALAADLDENLAETCDNIDSPKTSPTPSSKKFAFDTEKPQFLSYLPGRMYHSINGHIGSPIRVPRSESKDSLRSEPPHYRAQRERFKILINNNQIIPTDNDEIHESQMHWKERTNLPFEGNTNIVLQLFKQLQSMESPQVPDVNTNGHSEDSTNNFISSRTQVYSPPVIGHNNQLISSFEHSTPCETPRRLLYNPDDIGDGDMSKFPDSNYQIDGSNAGSGWKRNSLSRDPVIREDVEENDYIPRNVVMRRKRLTDNFSSSSSLTKDGTSEDGDQTLVGSRCSSLSSLTTCYRSSWLSDVSSQRTSTLISPSDLPDSPGPADLVAEFTDKIADGPSLIRPQPSWPIGSLPSSEVLRRMSMESNVSVHGSNRSSISISPTSVIPERAETPERLQISPISPHRERSLRPGFENIGQSTHSGVNNLFTPVACPRSGIPVKSFRGSVALETSPHLDFHNILPGQPQAVPSLCDDNDNLVNNRRNDISQAFASKCLSVCKKYPALSHKSSFEPGKGRTSIPQVIRGNNPNFDYEQHPKQLHVKSQSLPVYKGTAAVSSTEESLRPTAANRGSSSTEDNGSEDNILSSSPSACGDESEGVESDVRTYEKTRYHGSEVVLRANRSKCRKTKAYRRSVEVRPPSSEEESEPPVNLIIEEKLKEHRRGSIPDLLEGAAFSNMTLMTDSVELRRGAQQIAAQLEEGLSELTPSSASCDLRLVLPPSCMESMTSSGLSDLLSNGYVAGKRAAERRRRSRKMNGHRLVLRPTLTSTLEPTKNTQVSASASLENMSGTSDLLDNVNPPSLFDELSLSNSCASLNSISSDVLESRSHSLADPHSSSEMFQRLHAAAAFSQVYSREFNNMMTGSMNGSYTSDCLDHVKPPSLFKDIAEITLEDRSEIASDHLVSDFELEEELPHDDEPPPVPPHRTSSCFPFLFTNKKAETENLNGAPFLFDNREDVPFQFSNTEGVNREDTDSSPFLFSNREDFNSSLERESEMIAREYLPAKQVSNLILDPHRSGANSAQNLTTDDDHSSGFYSNLTTEDRCSTERDIGADSEMSSPPVTRRTGPRIIKPINRDTIRQMQERKSAEKTVPLVARPQQPCSRNLLQQVTSARINGSQKSGSEKTPSPSVSGVRMTRTSALRAKQAIAKSNGRSSPRSFLSRPPPPKNTARNLRQKSDVQANAKCEPVRPPPPVKQNTFTKDETPKMPLGPKTPSPGDDTNNNDKSKNGKVCSPTYSVQRTFSGLLLRRSNEATSSGSQGIAQAARKAPEKKSPTGNVPMLGGVGVRTGVVTSQPFRKEVQSKISSIWKRSDAANTPAADSFTPRVKTEPMRCNSVVLPSTHKAIPRSSTYEKLSKPAPTPTIKPRQTSTPTTVPKSKPPSIRSSRNPASASQPRATGGARIVKPVTPRPKPPAITSRTLRLSSTFGGDSCGPPSYISSGRSYGSGVSVPLVTPPFAVAPENGLYSQNDTFTKAESDSDDEGEK